MKKNNNILNTLEGQLNEQLFSRVKIGIKIKFVIFTFLSLLISPPIAIYIQGLLGHLDFIPNTIGVYINSSISMIVTISILLFMTNRIILRPILKINHALARMADGDLSTKVELKTYDEIHGLADSLNRAMEKVSNMLGEIKNSTYVVEDVKSEFERVAIMVEENSKESSDIALANSEGSERQKNELIEISQTLVELSSLIQIAKKRVEQVEDVSNKSNELSKEGAEVVKKSTQTVKDSYEKVREVVERMNELQGSSKQLTTLLNQIEEIANQTSLLSLNASIEAARAGEHGKGFAVVAQEIRKLSEQVKHTMVQSQGVVDGMFESISDSVNKINEGSDKIIKGVDDVSRTETYFNDIRDVIQEVLNKSLEIKEVTNEEVASSEQIIKLINTVSSSSEEYAKSSIEVSEKIIEQTKNVEDILNCNNKLDVEMKKLKNDVEKFKTEGDESIE